MSDPSPLIADVRRRLADSSAETLSAATFAARRGAGILADDAVLARWEHDLAAQLHGAGPLEPLLALPGITDVLVNGPDEVYIDCGDGLVRAAVTFATDDDIRGLASRLAAAAGRRLDDAQPFVDAHLPDGTRLHAILPPLAAHPTLSLRVLGRRRLELTDLVDSGTVSPELANLLRAIVAARLAFVISGGTGSGKTTVLGALLGQVAVDQRIVTIEDAAEIVTSHPHVVRLVTRSANVEGAGAVGLRELVRQALRMRPDRVVVGEFRGAEIVELLAALNTGHAGGGATVHANSIADVPARLEALGALGGLDRQSLAAQAAAALDVVLHLGRDEFGRRRLEAIGWLTRSVDGVSATSAWTRDAGPGPAAPALAARLAAPVPLILDEAG
jgi:pilus assembly protein CpaF